MDDASRGADADDRLTEAPFDLATVVDAMAPLLGLRLSPESRAEAIAQLQIAADRAALVLSAAFEDEDEPEPAFRA